MKPAYERLLEAIELAAHRRGWDTDCDFGIIYDRRADGGSTHKLLRDDFDRLQNSMFLPPITRGHLVYQNLISPHTFRTVFEDFGEPDATAFARLAQAIVWPQEALGENAGDMDALRASLRLPGIVALTFCVETWKVVTSPGAPELPEGVDLSTIPGATEQRQVIAVNRDMRLTLCTRERGFGPKIEQKLNMTGQIVNPLRMLMDFINGVDVPIEDRLLRYPPARMGLNPLSAGWKADA